MSALDAVASSCRGGRPYRGGPSYLRESLQDTVTAIGKEQLSSSKCLNKKCSFQHRDQSRRIWNTCRPLVVELWHGQPPNLLPPGPPAKGRGNVYVGIKILSVCMYVGICVVPAVYFRKLWRIFGLRVGLHLHAIRVKFVRRDRRIKVKVTRSKKREISYSRYVKLWWPISPVLYIFTEPWSLCAAWGFRFNPIHAVQRLQTSTGVWTHFGPLSPEARQATHSMLWVRHSKSNVHWT